LGKWPIESYGLLLAWVLRAGRDRLTAKLPSGWDKYRLEIPLMEIIGSEVGQRLS